MDIWSLFPIWLYSYIHWLRSGLGRTTFRTVSSSGRIDISILFFIVFRLIYFLSVDCFRLFSSSQTHSLTHLQTTLSIVFLKEDCSDSTGSSKTLCRTRLNSMSPSTALTTSVLRSFTIQVWNCPILQWWPTPLGHPDWRLFFDKYVYHHYSFCFVLLKKKTTNQIVNEMWLINSNRGCNPGQVLFINHHIRHKRTNNHCLTLKERETNSKWQKRRIWND